jgi:hypothetical protein
MYEWSDAAARHHHMENKFTFAFLNKPLENKNRHVLSLAVY